MRTHLGRALARVAACSLGVLGLLLPTGTAQLALDHDAPRLGQTLTVELRGAPPGARLALYAAPAAGSTATPWGELELDRASAEVLAAGTADSAGAWTHALAVPLERELAEAELHLQALVRDAAATGGAALSPALHLRLVGPRAYAAWRGGPDADGIVRPGGLVAVSLATGAELWTVELGPPPGPSEAQGDGRVTCDARLAHAALVSPAGELVVCDPAFGAVRATRAFVEPSGTLAVAAGGRELLVLETGYRPGLPPVAGRLHWVDPGTGASTTTLALGGVAPGAWTTDPARTVALVGELDPASGRTRVRFVDLLARRVRGAIEVGASGHVRFEDLACAAGQLFAATRDEGVTAIDARLTRLDLATGAVTQLAWTEDRTRLEPCPARDELWLGGSSAFGFGGSLRVTALAAPAPLVDVPGAPPGYFVPDVLRELDGEAWILDRAGNEPPNGDDPARLWTVDPASGTWTLHPTVWYAPEGPPVELDVLRDALVDVVLLARRGFAVPGGPAVDPALTVIDRATGREVSRPLGPEPVLVQGAGLGPD